MSGSFTPAMEPPPGGDWPPASVTGRSSREGIWNVRVPVPPCPPAVVLSAPISQFVKVAGAVPRVMPFSTPQIFQTASPAELPVPAFGPSSGVAGPPRWLRSPFWWWQTICPPLAEHGIEQSWARAVVERRTPATPALTRFRRLIIRFSLDILLA